MMTFNPDVHHRRSIRLKNFDYSSNGMYFITICSQDRENLFGEIVGALIQSFKRNTTIQFINGVKTGIYQPFNKRVWQRNYYEHIIRNENDYKTKWDYIDQNPLRWHEDEYYI